MLIGFHFLPMSTAKLILVERRRLQLSQRKMIQSRPRIWREFILRPKLWQCCAMIVLGAFLVYTAEMLFVRMAFFQGRWAVWWPSNGIALGALLLTRRRHWPCILIAFASGVALSEAHESMSVILTVAASNMLEVLGPALVLPHFRSMDKWLAQPGIAVHFILVAIVAAPVLSSLLAPSYYHGANNESYWLAVIQWAAADVLGIALSTPLVLALFSSEMWALFRPFALPKTLALFALMLGASRFVFEQTSLPLAFILYPLILMVGTQLGLSGAAVALNAMAVIATAATLHGMGPFGTLHSEPADIRVLLLQLFLVLSFSMTLPASVARVRRLTVEAKLKRALQRMEALASLDGLTGVANRRHFDQVFSLEWARARRERSPVALLMIDTDRFKAFNDQYGHLSGDACLRSVARAIVNIPRRPADLVARYGGEEFAVLLPGSDAAGACVVAEAVRDAIYALAVPHETSEEQRVTVSIGVAAMVPTEQIDAVELIAMSDDALYSAKHAGRNRVQMASELLVGQ